MNKFLVTATCVLSAVFASLSPSCVYAQSALSPFQRKELTDYHNKKRAEVDVGPVTWSDEVANVAQKWANHLAATGTFKHNNTKYGENIAINSTALKGAEAWYSEIKNFRPGVVMGPAAEGKNDYTIVGHYTQMVWSKTTKIGAGVAVMQSGPYKGQLVIVCNYDPPGNYSGQLAYAPNAKVPMVDKPLAAPAKMNWKDEHTQLSGGPIMVTGVPNLATFGKPDPTREGLQSLIYNGVLRADRKYTIETKSTDFNTHLELKNINGKEAYGRNGRPNAVLEFQPKANGTYQLKASSSQAGATGQLEVWITSNPSN
ncbi:CAP family protein [Rubinisphaera italica]|uniref:Cysteine-rich secretory protein family protein n=1 Tax=Rubinisphaera italica TaxID=2527969 RepID=A0A5C5XCN8_9PLAN|nr:CAP family protein [Rubinisphaera italica]TWT60740.1 Cysteine-rich secretory protein family protein [Rubinisphaera italica]